MISWLILFGVIIATVIIIRDTKKNYIKRRNNLRVCWGKGVNLKRYDDPDVLESLVRYWEENQSKVEGEPYPYIDEITWNDLNMDEIFKQVNRTQSSPGEEMLYARLHTINDTEEKQRDFEACIQIFVEHEELRVDVEEILMNLGKIEDNGIYYYINHINSKKINSIWLYRALGIVPGIALLGIFISPISVLILIGSLVVNLMIHYRSKNARIIELNTIKYITKLLVSAKRLGKIENIVFDRYGKTLKDLSDKCKGVSKYSSSLLGQDMSEMDFIAEYLRIITLSEMINYNKMIEGIKSYNKECIAIYEMVGTLDSAIAVGSYREYTEIYTMPTYHEKKEFIIENVYHPLLEEAVMNDIDWKEDVLLTGSNAAGKSTFIKSIAISAILGQSINTCFATRFCMPHTYVLSSMAIKDNIVNGESYFIAEIKSLKRVVDRLQTKEMTICFIDEILKGTNTVERIAASSSVLEWIHKQNSLCMAATHDIELTKILKEKYDQYHFTETVTEEGVSFSYELQEGPATSRNAIALLDMMGYDKEIIKSSRRIADSLETKKSHTYAIVTPY